MLTPAEELHLGTLVQRWQCWDGGPDAAPALVRRRGLRARERMVVANLRLVVSATKKYLGVAEKAGMAADDLLQLGALGLMRCSEKFDPARGYKFSTYAYWWIRQGITRRIGSGSVIHVSQAAAEQMWRVAKEGRLASLSESERQTFLCVIRAQSVGSLDAVVGNGETTLGELVPGPEQDPLERVDAETLVARLRELAPGDMALLEEAQAVGHTEIAKRQGVTRSCLSARVDAARKRVRALAATA